jgi:hypothetical protein
LFRNQTQEEFLLEHGVNYYSAMADVNLETPKDSKLLFVAELRGYYSQRNYLTNTDPHDDNEIILQQLIIASQNIEELLQKLQRMEITHILVNASEMKRLAKVLDRDTYFEFPTEKDQTMYRTLFSPQYLRPLVSKNLVTIYEILYPEEIKKVVQ